MYLEKQVREGASARAVHGNSFELAFVLLVIASARAQTCPPQRESVSSGGAQGSADHYLTSLAPDGRFVAFDTESAFVSSVTNFDGDCYVRDRRSAAPSSSSDHEAHSARGTYRVSSRGAGAIELERAPGRSWETGTARARSPWTTDGGLGPGERALDRCAKSPGLLDGVLHRWAR